MVVRWRLVDLRDEIGRTFGVHLHERSVGKVLARLNFSRISVRPRHPDQDPVAQEAHKKTSPRWSPPPFPTTPVASRSNSGGRCYEADTIRYHRSNWPVSATRLEPLPCR